MALMTFGDRLWRVRDLAADGGVRALDLVVDGLADVVQQAAGLGDLDVGADFAGDDGRQSGGLDRRA